MIDPVKINDKLSERLYKYREEREWSRRELAYISTVSDRTIDRLEKYGNEFTPSLATLIYLANAFDITLSELFEGL